MAGRRPEPGPSAGAARQRREVRRVQHAGTVGHGEPRGRLLACGGREAREPGQPMPVLAEVAAAVGGRDLVLIAAASAEPAAVIASYRAAFADLGVQVIHSLGIESHRDAYDPRGVRRLQEARAVYFTGGDQRRITSLIGGSPFLDAIRSLYRRGGMVAGSSAGAAALSGVMLSGGPAAGAPGAIVLGPGLGLLPEAIIDTHFSQRARMDRLLKAVALQPGLLGIGLDEDTAIVVERGATLRTVGTGSVRILDGAGVTYSSLSDRGDAGVLGLHSLLLHALGPGDRFDLVQRRPVPASLPAGAASGRDHGTARRVL